jgi:hypothetical protein
MKLTLLAAKLCQLGLLGRSSPGCTRQIDLSLESSNLHGHRHQPGQQGLEIVRVKFPENGIHLLKLARLNQGVGQHNLDHRGFAVDVQIRPDDIGGTLAALEFQQDRGVFQNGTRFFGGDAVLII